MTEQRAETTQPEREVVRRIAGEVVLSDDPGATLRKWREEFGVSQSELSDEIDVSNSVVSDYESGRRESPGTAFVRRTVEALVDIDMRKGGETVQRYKRVLGAGFEGGAIRDLRDYETPVSIDDFYDAIDVEVIVEKDGELKGHTVVDSVEAITSFTSDEFSRLYGWSTERALIFTRITRGESPLVAIRVTNLRPSTVVLHDIEAADVSEMAPRIARLEGVGLARTTLSDEEMMSRLRGV